jgi:hypothetical protein
MNYLGAAALTASVLLLPAAHGEEGVKPDFYSAVWAMVGGSGGGSTVSINIHINRYNTNEDIKKFADLLAQDGPDRLRRALEDEDVGQLSSTGSVGTPIAIARKLVKGNKTIIRVVTARNLSFAELRNSGRSVDYPFTMLELVLDKDGKGTGTAIGAAKIRFNKKKNIYEIESLQHGTAYNKLLNVQRMT